MYSQSCLADRGSNDFELLFPGLFHLYVAVDQNANGRYQISFRPAPPWTLRIQSRSGLLLAWLLALPSHEELSSRCHPRGHIVLSVTPSASAASYFCSFVSVVEDLPDYATIFATPAILVFRLFSRFAVPPK